MNDQITHGLSDSAIVAHSTSVYQKVGSPVIMPAKGPWLIHHVWGYMLHSTPSGQEPLNPVLKFDSPTGDIVPYPAPSHFPLTITGPGDNVNCGSVQTPLSLIPVYWTIDGKASFQAYSLTDIASFDNVAVQWGILFSREYPILKPITFCDHVSGPVAPLDPTTLGTIHISENAQRLTAISCSLNSSTSLGAAKEIAGTISLTSSDIDLVPSVFPLDRTFHGAFGTPVNLPVGLAPTWIPLNTDIIPGSKIDVSCTLFKNDSNNAQVMVFLAYE